MPLVIGVDGGGTRTRVALVDEHGRVLGLGTAGPSNYDDVGIAVTRDNIGLAVQRAWQQAGLSPCLGDAVFLGMAGVVSEADRATIRQIALELALAPAGQVHVDHDIRIALAGGLAGQPGIALIVGTGSSCYGRRADGRSWRAGGWGHLLDDLGSGYYLGVQAMVAAVRAADGRGPETALLPAVMGALKLEDIQGIMRRLYHQGLTRAEIAALAPLVLDAAASGDLIARQIIERGVDELALMVETVARQLDFLPGPVSVTVTGGLARSGPAYWDPLCAAIRRRIPTSQVVEPILPPVLGAALLALEALGIGLSPELIARLRAQAAKEVL
ncbi:MAG: BadF/BadG/BcrA/BcrD ATPase family protein [Anaerolineae bacterium]|nr:ATPase [Anaerolineae bacterium]MDW8100990.1 BadF/BadG/BcrA/BcrD ATPase family protein [Anaerolineae bacterium]